MPVELWRILGRKIIFIQHIKSQPHKNNIKNCDFNGYILELSKKVQKDEAKDLSGASIESGSRV